MKKIIQAKSLDYFYNLIVLATLQ